MRNPEQRITMRRLFEMTAVLVCTVSLVFATVSIAMVLLGRHSAGTRDYIEYWASGQQLAHHQNPYDATAVLKLEQTAGLPIGTFPMVMGNAPPALLLTYPLGFVRPDTGQYAWMLLLLGSLVLSVRLMLQALGSGRTYVQILAFTFAPSLVCVAAGQMALLVLLGVAVFLRFQRTRPLLAGAALWFCLLKPQLFVPFGLVLCLWTLRNRQFRILVGAGLAVIVSAALISWLDPRCWVEYGAFMRTMRYDKVSIPCISVVLRDGLPTVPFVQYAPALLGSAWAVAFFWRQRNQWEWIEHGSPVLLVSLMVAPYTWFIDQCVALAPMLRGLHVTRSRTLLVLLALASALIELSPLTGRDLLHSKFYLWTMPFWLAWYVAAVHWRSVDNIASRSNANESRTSYLEGTVAITEEAGV
jgi:hypothetical protein